METEHGFMTDMPVSLAKNITGLHTLLPGQDAQRTLLGFVEQYKEQVGDSDARNLRGLTYQKIMEILQIQRLIPSFKLPPDARGIWFMHVIGESCTPECVVVDLMGEIEVKVVAKANSYRLPSRAALVNLITEATDRKMSCFFQLPSPDTHCSPDSSVYGHTTSDTSLEGLLRLRVC